jgi:hypothetical protein
MDANFFQGATMQRQPAVITGTVGVIVVASWTLLAAGQLHLAPV